jgi:hypothetical protein
MSLSFEVAAWNEERVEPISNFSKYSHVPVHPNSEVEKSYKRLN